MAPRTFLVTGTSSGFGNNLVQEILRQRDNVVATSRDVTQLNFANAESNNLLAIPLDVTNPASVENAFSKALSSFGRIDVVVNNAGFGLCGPLEELDDEQIRQQMEVNFFGCLNVTRTAVRIMREQTPSGGLIQQISSMAGQKGMPTFSIYCATKWALEGFSEAVAAEMKPEWGIKIMIVEPGGFRTNWAGPSMSFPKLRLAAYDHLDAKERMRKRHGTQIGNPAKAGRALYKLAVMENPPLRVALGSDAYQVVMEKLQEYQSYTALKDFSHSTDFDHEE
ncbi:uncharacterized protein Z520_07185 [Fonsecaea multimorphosa CBS 102226]|uniref:NAD(P)-binding protein n=1 Tax=Fonsecaea multimorphosa CBS 102226 TaxID=1442371 RepID=A0A0D2IJ51_9EURO|nr:uncharacterized protein Z520_07185 [Fonsecaea multimorphosa CBS 102226]KIX97071.1 hypothetical protein Z520_07185 [Fonsecaea multimorphosa CBS 102226]OAL22847.1 hypothetical protein AYO22_06755 [Fonsecaea multimorphosa]